MLRVVRALARTRRRGVYGTYPYHSGRGGRALSTPTPVGRAAPRGGSAHTFPHCRILRGGVQWRMDYDAIVIGGGHAGIEASLALARLGYATLMVTQHLDTIGKLSCNPAIGGLAKGNMVREIDALGGEMGRIVDKTMIQFRVLNRSRGPAVQGPRAQADKAAYQACAKETLEGQDNLYLFQDTVSDLLLSGDDREVRGVETVRGRRFTARAVVLTTGTFLNGRVFIGEYSASSGRLGEPAAAGLERVLGRTGFRMGRLKTGTPARVHRDSLDFSKLERQFGDEEIVPFSFGGFGGGADGAAAAARVQLPCYVTFTNEKTHQIIRDNMGRSPLYSGKINGVGTRYCPSIEDKVVKFPDRDRHQIFIEPEGMRTKEMYLNGISSSMPEDVQERFIHSIPGMRDAYIMRPGYAVEYDYMDPSQLYPSLESKRIRRLFVAGQSNGSSGYEEAAGQGLMAGINAARLLQGAEPVILQRSEAYIGVMIDDLVTLGTKEPYRMFTSRAEHRLALRYDSCDRRLSGIGHRVGLVDDEKFARLQEKIAKIDEIKELLGKTGVNRELVGRASARAAGAPGAVSLTLGRSLYDALKKPEINFADICAICPEHFSGIDGEWLKQIELDVKYEGYVQRQDDQVRRFKKMEHLTIPAGIDYTGIKGISNESREKFLAIEPQSIGQAARIPGVRNSDIAVLMLHVTRARRGAPAARAAAPTPAPAPAAAQT